jgi:hypothetical protein
MVPGNTHLDHECAANSDPIMGSAEERFSERRWCAGVGYDTSPQVGRCRAPDGAGGEPSRNQGLRKTAALWSAPGRSPLTC